MVSNPIQVWGSVSFSLRKVTKSVQKTTSVSQCRPADISKIGILKFDFKARNYSKITYLSCHRSKTSFVSTLSVQILQILLIFSKKIVFLDFLRNTFSKSILRSAGRQPADIWTFFPKCRPADMKKMFKFFSRKKIEFCFKKFLKHSNSAKKCLKLISRYFYVFGELISCSMCLNQIM